MCLISRGDLLQPIFVVQSAEHLLNSYPTIRQFLSDNPAAIRVWDASGFKIDYFPIRPLGGLFVGADSNYSRVRFELDQTHERRYRNLAGPGPPWGMCASR